MLLDGVLLKLDRAAQICDLLADAARAFVEGELSSGLRFVEPDLTRNGWHTLTVGPVPEPDPMLGVILGEFVHNVRSALDQMVWSLVLAAGGTPGGHTHFPVTESKTQWQERIAAGGTKLPPTHELSPEAFALVEEFQPFQLPRKERHDAALMRLVRVSNEDKHRTLHVGLGVPVQYSPPAVEPPGFLEFYNPQRPQKVLPLREGAAFLRFKVKRTVWPPPPYAQLKITWAPSTGVHLLFYRADGTPAVAVDHLSEMLETAQQLASRARELPEVAQ